MGYSIDYKGKLKIKDPKGQMAEFEGEDVRDHKWTLPEGYFFHIDFERSPGNPEIIEHNGSEKSYGGAEQLQTIVMNSDIEIFGKLTYRSDYGDTGTITCKGKVIEDKPKKKSNA